MASHGEFSFTHGKNKNYGESVCKPRPIPFQSWRSANMFMFWKNKNPEKTGARVRNTPLGAYCYALTNKRT
uniref:Uncharacterized protein n=1 Tax=Candidatus Kentrum sp. SD TaxID=2126332 RepID=A0A451BQN6_9GAMM|nr:MAG: hypothetical protein BECKSD772F_GA0070984_103310 [Candidatus Kentron sp. SD]VFK44622.1 MAG: hypothetical protein BECKSD772E_GA0070983_10417 [Candidatus Kentron sp. SD]VFK80547.1 MAG: hypothetical protein BECKSD772D_GA0070982_11267 [Candidatus Kentron sp. SD]